MFVSQINYDVNQRETDCLQITYSENPESYVTETIVICTLGACVRAYVRGCWSTRAINHAVASGRLIAAIEKE